MYIETGQVFKWRQRKRKGNIVSILNRYLVMMPLVLISTAGIALAAPTDGVITGGSGTIEIGSATNVNQVSPRLDINWQTFSTEVHESVNFTQPTADALAINRVIGGVPSELRGALNANGRVVILNDSGITFFGTSQVNVGALLATTATNLSTDGDRLSFSGAGYGTVLNQGSIRVSDGGFAVLAAPYVSNTGFIQANLGTIQLASANDFTVDFRGDGLIGFTVSKSTLDGIVEAGKALGVDNTGTLLAGSGAIGISAGAASSIVQSVVNLDGVVDASSFGAGTDGGTVLVTSVGDINIGGEVHADGGVSGNGGTVTTWADATNVFGPGAVITARGGEVSGDGGFVEVSGNDVRVRGTVNASAPNGEAGTFLIDPAFAITIADGACPTAPCDPNAPDAPTVYEEDIETTSGNGTNVSLVAENSITMQDLTDNVLKGGDGYITMTAGGYFGNGAVTGTISFVDTINDKIATTSGAISMTANDGAEGGGSIDIGHLETLHNNANITLTAGLGGIKAGNLCAGGGDVCYEPAVNNPGDITLTTTGSITTGDVKIFAESTDSASAFLTMTAGGDLTAGDITLTAIDPAWSIDNATAIANLSAGGSVTAGNVSVTAEGEKNVTAAFNVDANGDINLGVRLPEPEFSGLSVSATALDGGSDSAVADAAVSLNGQDVLINGDIKVIADALNNIDSSATASAVLAINATNAEGDTGDIEVTGSTVVTASAAFGVSNLNASTASAFASADLIAGGDITLGGVTVDADADGSLAPNAWNASADAELYVDAGNDINITGDVLVKAEATLGAGGTDSADADAYADLYAGNDVNINGGLTVTAVAVNNATYYADEASADADLSVDAGNDINITGDVLVKTEATLGAGGTGSADADAYADFDSGGDMTVNGDITVEAIAENTSGSDATADADLYMEAIEGDVNITGDILVRSEATLGAAGTDSASASASAEIYGYDVNITGDVTVTAIAVNNGTEASDATASADLDIEAYNDLTITGNTLVTADATAAGSYGSAYASAYADISANNNVTVNGDLTVDADAVSTAGSASSVSAYATLLAIASWGDLNITGDIDVTADATHGEGYYSAEAVAVALLTGGNDVNITTGSGTINVAANAVNEGSGSAAAGAALVAAAGVDGNNLIGLAEGIANGYTDPTGINVSEVSELFGSGDLYINGDIKATARADAASGNADAVAAAIMAAGNDATILTDPITVRSEANAGAGYGSPDGYPYYSYGGGADAKAALICAAGIADVYEDGQSGSLYITGDVSATAIATGTSYDSFYYGGGSGFAFTDLFAADDLTVLGADPLAYAPTMPGADHARVQGKESATDPADTIDGCEGGFCAELVIDAGGTVLIEPKPVVSAPQPVEDNEHEVVSALETKEIRLIEPLGPGKDPLRFDLDGLALWATGAGVTAPSEGSTLTPDIEEAIAKGVDPTTVLPAPAAGGGMGLSSGVDAYSVGGPDFCDQVVSGYCLPQEGKKKTE